MEEIWNDLEPWSKSYYCGPDYGDRGLFVFDYRLKECPGLLSVLKHHQDKQPFKGVQVSGCLHMTQETVSFAYTLSRLGAEVRWCSSNPNSSNDIAIFTANKLFHPQITLFGRKNESMEEYFWCMYQTLNWPDKSKPLLLVDDGCCIYSMILYGKELEDKYNETGELYDLSKVNLTDRDKIMLFKFLNHCVPKNPTFFNELVLRIVGLSEETTSGLGEFRKFKKQNKLLFPIYSTNDVISKSKFDNNYGARYSAIDGLHRGAEGVLVGGREVVVIGYGHVGKGVCLGFRGAGAIVKVCEADPLCAMQSVMDGFPVVLLEDTLETADMFITATGGIEIIRLHHVRRMKDRAILGNIGQGDREIAMTEILSDPYLEIVEVKENTHYYKFKDTGKGVIILSHGRLYNLGCANGHPSFVMSMSFTTQFFALLQLYENKGKLDNSIHVLPKLLDETIARYHLEALNVKLTVLTDNQCEFLGWCESSKESSGRINKFQKVSLVSRILNTNGLPLSKRTDTRKPEIEFKKQIVKKGYVTVLTPLLETYERYRGQLGLSLQLQKVSLYYAVDYSNDPIVSQYPKNEKAEVYKPQSQFYKLKKPNYYTLVEDFLNLFTQDKQERLSPTYSLKQLNTGLPNGVLLFMDPNSCADHVVELNKQDKEARLTSTKLNTVFKLFETGLNFFRNKDTVNLVIPFSESLVYATNKGGSNFNGTPVFTTNPPIYVSKKADSNKEDVTNTQNDKFNSNYKLLVFFTPTDAKEFYKKVRWEKTYKDEKTGNFYRIWSKSPPFRPDVKVTSLEKIYGRVHGSEPFWGYLLEVMPPNVKLEKRTEFMLKESSNLLLVPWYSLKKVLRGFSL